VNKGRSKSQDLLMWRGEVELAIEVAEAHE